ncbi:zinc finger MYM-type protein 1-like [Aphis craccivora]|uniref:Zinc finger MYM-type protein 1-like n=1 Tax=Aphis craccivora TaxID=307492 RepID=A0A6G0YLJ9_APHCR|nr:zinc finger MYM-type protein 1-like [Aphis craccivora]
MAGEKYTSNNDSEHESEENSDSDQNEDEGEINVHKHKNLDVLLHMLQVCHKAGLKMTTISQDRLEQLLLMSCESDVEIDNGQVIDIFSNCSSVLKKHLL